MEAELLQVWMERHWDKVFKGKPGSGRETYELWLQYGILIQRKLCRIHCQLRKQGITLTVDQFKGITLLPLRLCQGRSHKIQQVAIMADSPRCPYIVRVEAGTSVLSEYLRPDY
jgi:hypothetical protein